MNRFGEYAPIIVQGLMTILVVNHWYRGLDWMPLFLVWFIMLGFFISPLMVQFNEDDEFDDEYLN